MSGPDLSSVTAVVDFFNVVQAIAEVAGILVTVYCVQRGAKMVLAAVRGDDSLGDATYSEWILNRVNNGDFVSRKDFESVASSLPEREKRNYARHTSRYW